MSLQLEVGKWYRRRDGVAAKIIDILETTQATAPYLLGRPFESDLGVFYPDSGLCSSLGDSVALDLIAEIVDDARPVVSIEPVDQTNSEPGLRYDAGKSRVDLIPPEFILALGQHFGVGAKKYSEDNWKKGMSWSRCYACALRHMMAFWAGEDLDAETGTPHVIAAAWNIAALHWYKEKGVGTDDRPNLA